MQCYTFTTACYRGGFCTQGGHFAGCIMYFKLTSIIHFYIIRLREEASRVGLKGHADNADNVMKKEQADGNEEIMNKMKSDDNERKLSMIITSKELEIKAKDEKIVKMEEEIKEQAMEIRMKHNEIKERDVELEKLRKLEERMEIEENGSKDVSNNLKTNEEIISKLLTENQELKEKVALNEQIDKQLDASGNQMVKELQDKIELLQDKKERSEDLNNNASIKYQKLMKANDELKNKVQLYKGMVSLRDQVTIVPLLIIYRFSDVISFIVPVHHMCCI